MKLSSRSYPHPVVGHEDDVPEYAFQATVTHDCTETSLVLDVAVQCSCPSLARYVQRRQASYTLHVECGKTLFRQAYPFNTATHRVEIPFADLNEMVELTPLAVAVRPIANYRVDGANPVYGDTAFAVQPGDVLAVGDPQECFVPHDRDPLRRIGSIVKIQVSGEADGPMRVDHSGHKIYICLSESDYAAYAVLRNNPQFRDLLATSLVLPALAEAVRLRRTEPDTHAELKWAQVIDRRVDDLGLDAEEPLVVAQRLYGMPVRRALDAARAALDAVVD